MANVIITTRTTREITNVTLDINQETACKLAAVLGRLPCFNGEFDDLYDRLSDALLAEDLDFGEFSLRNFPSLQAMFQQISW